MLNISTSALLPSQYRKFTKGWDKERYADLFRKYTGDRNNYRIHIPLVAGAKRIAYAPVPEAIQKSVAEKGYTVEDYITGIAVDATGKRRIKIGKLLSPELQKEFAADKTRSNARNAATGNQMVVISRHPYDVAGMSTDRGWVSCMHLVGGSNAKHVKDDVAQGSIIAYLVNKDDINLQRPSARILMRVYRADNGKKGLFPSGVYGARSQLFFDTVRKWCSEVNNTYFGIPYGMSMELLGDLYNDGHMRVINDDYDPANALKELETTLRENPKMAVEEYDRFSSKFGSDVSEFFNLANSIGEKKLDVVLAPQAVRQIRIQLEDGGGSITNALKGAAEIAARGYVLGPEAFVTSDAIAIIRTSAVVGQKLLSLADGLKVAAAMSREERDMSMSNIYRRLMETEATRALLDVAPKFGVSPERALSWMTADTFNSWHRVALTKAEIKALKKGWAEEGVDELPDYYEAALAPASKMPAMFKKYVENLNREVITGRTTGKANRPKTMQLFIERMPEDKWSTAFRGSYLLPLLVGTTFARDTDKKALEAMRPFFAKRVADYLKSDTKNGSRILRLMLPIIGAMSGPQYGFSFFNSMPDEVWMDPAAATVALDAMLNGSGSRAEIESSMGLTSWLSASPIRIMALANTEDFNSGSMQAVMNAIAQDPKSYAKIANNIRTALKNVPGFAHAARSLPLVQAATNVAEYEETAKERGIDIVAALREGYGVEFHRDVIQRLLASRLANV